MRKVFALALAAVVAALSLAAGAATAPGQTTSLTIYSGREETSREADHGSLHAGDGHRAQGAVRLVDDARDRARRGGPKQPGRRLLVAGAGHARAGRLRAGSWRGSRSRRSARCRRGSPRAAGAGSARAVAPASSSTTRTTSGQAELPASVWGLTNAKWKGKIGVAPTNASFQAFLGATIHLFGEARVRAWLEGLRENDVRFYPNNTTVVQAVGRGDVQVGLVNHYYLYNLLAETPEPAGAQPLVPRRRSGQPRARRGRRHRLDDAEARCGAAVRRLPALEERRSG